MQRVFVSVLALGVVAGCSGGANETASEPAAGAETTVQPAVEETAALDDAEEGGSAGDPEAVPGPEETVCSRFAYDLRGMPHTGPYQVDTEQITSRTRGMIHDVQVAAGEPTAHAFTSGVGSSTFTAVFISSHALEQCERARAEVAPPIADSVRGRRRFRLPTSTECGPCSQLVLDALQNEEDQSGAESSADEPSGPSAE